MKTILIIGSALLLAGCGGGGSDSSPATSNAEGFKISSHWEMPVLDLGMSNTRVKTRRSILLYNDGNKVADFTLLYNLPPDLAGNGCVNVQPGTACQAVFWWTPSQGAVLSASVYPTREQSQATALLVQGAAVTDAMYALAPFWSGSGSIQWEGEANFTPSNGHSVVATRIAWSSGGMAPDSRCEAVFKGDVAGYLDGQALQVKSARFALSKGESFTRNGESFTRYQSNGDALACDLAKLAANSGSYILNI